MLEQPIYALTEPARLRELLAGHGWATLVSAPDTGGGPVVSHLPVIPDPQGGADGLAVLGHLAKADAEMHQLGAHDVVVIVQGPGGYVSPSHYRAGPYVPTWNFVVVHLHGRPTVLDGEQTYQVLQRTVEHFEAGKAEPWRLETVEDYAREIAPYTTGFRLRPTRVVGKHKLSQDKPHEVALRVADALAADGPNGNKALAAAMRRVLVPGD
ncbi:FMN-binding negative transcriptional regulator [Actinacidiphila bryophytorum]|uniref:FMN-binding negative transcriptional regulator n=1 Tax=Actinacidiphila bryophytorum TaxID=1436133 RepID=UPI002176D2AA|nr:FMN-binding negative transcriptional regulator [Actinacidiphila bryophytorum]UWE10898.1 FMN-binding negative transcriptional regulator [Actinacidiphila bryophytorum]